jgi:hypothetical protein
MPILRRLAPLALVLLLAGCAAAPPAVVAARSADDALVAEARAFMAAYGNDLGTGDREAIAGRYDRRGAYIMFNGMRELAPWDSLAAQYRTAWRPPAAFAWSELVYEPAGPDAVVVNGHFLWTLRAGEEPMRFRYTALLVRQAGALRIRLEDESMVTPPGPRPVEPT